MNSRGLLARLSVAALLFGASLALSSAARSAPLVQEAERITIDEFKALRARGDVVVVDVRGGGETKIKGAIHIPLDQLESRLNELPKPGGAEIVTYCS